MFVGPHDLALPPRVQTMPMNDQQRWVDAYNAAEADGKTPDECMAAGDAACGAACGSLAVQTLSAARVVQRNKNGSIVVEMPICAAATIDLSRTAGKGTSTMSLTRMDLEEMARNVGEWPGPIPVNVAPHRPFEATHGAAPGFLEAADVRGDQLWGRFTLTGDLAAQFERGQWRGFSVDLAKNPKLPSKQITGWAVWGGVFTNRPAAPVNFTIENGIAAEAACLYVEVLRAQPVVPAWAHGALVAARAIEDAQSERS